MGTNSRIKLLDAVYYLAVFIFLALTFTSKKVDTSSVAINIVLFAIVYLIFFNAKKAMCNIVDIKKDLQEATQKIIEDFEKEKNYLWNQYSTIDECELFQNENLKMIYKKYANERIRLAEISENKYKCDISNYINEEMIDNLMRKNVYNLVPGVMTGLGILGTFIGLSIGLQNFNTGNTEEIEASIAPLMNGIKVAFHTSIYGMLFSLLFNYVYKEVLEDAYVAVEEFLTTFENYVDSNALDNNGVEIQKLLKNIPETVGVTMANKISPVLDRMNITLENLSNNMAENQMKGLSEIVDHFIESMNVSLGDSFKSLGETIDKTVELQNRNNDTMTHILDEVQSMTRNIVDINTLSNQTVEHMAGYVKRIESLQNLLNENFESIGLQLEHQREYDDKLKEYIDILVNYERQIGEASNRFTQDMSKQLEYIGSMEEKISESTQEHMNMLTVKAEECNKLLTEAATQEMQSVLSMANEYSIKVTEHLNALENMNASLKKQSTDGLKILYENVNEYNETLSANIENYNKTLSENVENYNRTLSENVENYNRTLSENVETFNKTLFENTENHNKTLAENARIHNKKLFEEAKQQIDYITTMSNDKASEMEEASRNLVEASKELNGKLNVSLQNAFTMIDENLAEIARHLSGTISEIEETTERVPAVVQNSYDGMKKCFDEMKQKYENLVCTLDSMAKMSNEYKSDQLNGKDNI